MKRLVIKHVQDRLRSLGYGICQPQWDQAVISSAIPFSGMPDTVALARRLLDQAQAELIGVLARRWGNPLVILERSAGRMEVDIVSDADAIDLATCEALDHLVKQVETEANQLALDLHREATTIIRAGDIGEEVVKRLRMGNLELRVIETDDEMFTLEYWGEQEQEAFMRSVLDGASRYFSLRAEVCMGDLILGCETLYGVVQPTGVRDPFYDGARKVAVAEAIRQARATYAALQSVHAIRAA